MSSDPNRTGRIPLFPLEVVLLPGAPLPLHIFEPRYKEMIGRCMERRVEFGVVLQRASQIVTTGCTAEIHKSKPPMLQAGRSLAYRIAGELPLELEARQALLELRSEAARQEHLFSYLTHWVPRMRQVQRLKTRAGGNGRG
ncbi:MAG: LON peptidase substrate-binding domain-containing protein [Candidatus Acidiferrales bacterium]